MKKCKIEIPVSVGELLDKVSILLIKVNVCRGKDGQAARRELRMLNVHVERLGADALKYITALNGVNRRIWGIIDRQSVLIEAGEGDGREAAVLARDVVIYNQERFRIKAMADETFGSVVREVKKHQGNIPRPSGAK